MIASLLSRLRAEPALVLGLVQSVIALVAAFGLELSAEQTGAILAVTAAVLSIVTRQLVTPISKPPASAGPGAALLVLLALIALTGCTVQTRQRTCVPVLRATVAGSVVGCRAAYVGATPEEVDRLDRACVPLGEAAVELADDETAALVCRGAP